MNKKNRKCIYAGSFDPITSGHFWMIQEASKIFDELVVAIGINPQKKSNYPLEIRLQMMKDTLKEMANVLVTSFSGQFLVDFATTHGADFVLRGIRGETDFEYERGMRYINDKINPQLSTVFLIPPKNLSEISSSMVRGLMGPPGWTSIVKQFVPAAVFETVLNYEIKRQFISSFSGLTSSPLDDLYQEIAIKYSEPHRRYHNLSHIAECLSELHTVEISKENRSAVELAIWFHDVIYNPKSKTNEEDSAAYFEKKAQVMGLPSDLVQRVRSYIIATKYHEHPETNDKMLSYFLDIDLSILGSDENRFAAYDSAIREEFGWVPNLLYEPKRRKVLKTFLERKTLFQTPEFKDRYEERARVNLKKVVSS